MNRKLIKYSLWIIMTIPSAFVCAQEEERPKPEDGYVITGIIRNDFIGSQSDLEKEHQSVVELPWPEQTLENLDPKIREFIMRKTHTQQDDHERLRHYKELDARCRGMCFAGSNAHHSSDEDANFLPLKRPGQPSRETALRDLERMQKEALEALLLTRPPKEISNADLKELQSNLRLKNGGDPVDFDPLSDLEYTIRMNRSGKYKLGEPIFICPCIKNSSDDIIVITSVPPPARHLFSGDKISLVDADGDEVPMTRMGKQEYEELKNIKVDGKEFLRSRDYPYSLSLQEEKKLVTRPIVLNHYFDMTRPGVYYVTLHCIFRFQGQKYDEPLASNTLTIEVTEEFVTPDDLKNPDEFNTQGIRQESGKKSLGKAHGCSATPAIAIRAIRTFPRRGKVGRSLRKASRQVRCEMKFG